MISLDVVLVVVVVVGKASATEGADMERNEEAGTSGPDEEDVVQADASCEESKHAMARKTRLFVRRGNPHIQEGGVSRV